MTLSLPKPVRRGPKPRRRIARVVRPARKSKVSWKKQKAEADRLFSLIIRTRDDWTCRATGSLENPQCAHLVSRQYGAVRWDERNAVCLSQRAHMKFTHDPIAWEDWCDERFGPGRLVLLKTLARCHVRPDYESLLPALRARLRELEERRRAT